MSISVYLLDLKELNHSLFLEKFLSEAPSKVDEERRKKAEKIKNPHGRAVSLAAGMLLQQAVRNFVKAAVKNFVKPEVKNSTEKDTEYCNNTERDVEHCVLSVEELFQQIPEPIELQYEYGEMGKPRITNLPICFNLSHSGDYVLCAVSAQEIGADIQEIKNGNLAKIAERYFAEEELNLLQTFKNQVDYDKYLFELWTKKEAYGKLTGCGIAEVISQSIVSREELVWIPFFAPEGYAASICQAITEH